MTDYSEMNNPGSKPGVQASEDAAKKPGEKGSYKSSPRILIVDDSATIRFGLSRVLDKMGAIVTQASDGINGFEIAKSEDFDLIITDVEMPGMDGFSLCENLKKIQAKRSTPIIILSSREQEEDIERGFKVGAAGYVPKSCAKSELRERIEGILDRNALLKGRLVLVVDDSRFDRKITGNALLEAGFQVIGADDGRRALELLRDFTPDLILCDLNMPEIDGYQLCKMVHSSERLCDIPFIIMSADGDRATMRRLLQYGASAFLVKPFNVDQLVITAERLVSDHFRTLLKEKDRLESERKLIIGSITSLVLALEARDQYTRGHSDSVAAIAVAMTRTMGFDEEQIEKTRITGKLHDVGKIGIRDDILLKPGALTAEEYDIIKLHPSIGADILSPIPSLADVIPAIAGHHERLDGKGYPRGLKGSQIPLMARVIAVADTYDALTSNRSYRKGFPHEKALQIIDEVKGTQLCPDCVRVFINCLD